MRVRSPLTPPVFEGYQLTSAECVDTRTGRALAERFCQNHPENVKPKPRLQECSPEPCPAR